MKTLYENANYIVVIVDGLLTNGDKQDIYGVINKETGVHEEQIPQLVVACHAADQLNEELILFKESKGVASVRSINSNNNSIQ